MAAYQSNKSLFTATLLKINELLEKPKPDVAGALSHSKAMLKILEVANTKDRSHGTEHRLALAAAAQERGAWKRRCEIFKVTSQETGVLIVPGIERAAALFGRTVETMRVVMSRSRNVAQLMLGDYQVAVEKTLQYLPEEEVGPANEKLDRVLVDLGVVAKKKSARPNGRPNPVPRVAAGPDERRTDSKAAKIAMTNLDQAVVKIELSKTKHPEALDLLYKAMSGISFAGIAGSMGAENPGALYDIQEAMELLKKNGFTREDVHQALQRAIDHGGQISDARIDSLALGARRKVLEAKKAELKKR